MATPSNEQAPIAEALAGLTAALEHIQARHEAAQRASRRARLALSVVGLLIVGGAIYLALSPVAHLLPLIVPQQLSAVDREALKAEKRQLLDTLPAEERARYEVFERQVEFLDKYMGAYEDLDIAAAIALFLARMSRSVEVMPDMYEQVRFMSNEVSSMNNEMISMDANPATAGSSPASCVPPATNTRSCSGMWATAQWERSWTSAGPLSTRFSSIRTNSVAVRVWSTSRPPTTITTFSSTRIAA